MSDAEWTYASFGALGFAVLLISLLLGDSDVPGSDVSTEVDVHASAESGIDLQSPSWRNVTVIAAALAGFGICGLVTAASGAPLVFHVAASLFGFFVTGRISFLLYRWVLRQQYDSRISRDSYIGTEAVLTLPISQDGVGQVSFYDLNGHHTMLPARSENGQALPCPMQVLIIDVTDNGAVVSPNPNYPLEG